MTTDVEIKRHTLAGASLVQLAGEIDLATTPELRAELDAALAARPWVIVDLSRAEIIDSVGLSVLFTAHAAARRAGGDLMLAAPTDFLRMILRSARLSAVFPVFATVPQALSAVQAAALPRQRGRAA